jgi:hypothetical protein
MFKTGIFTFWRFMLPSIALFVKAATSSPFPMKAARRSRESFSRIVPTMYMLLTFSRTLTCKLHGRQHEAQSVYIDARRNAQSTSKHTACAFCHIYRFLLLGSLFFVVVRGTSVAL